MRKIIMTVTVNFWGVLAEVTGKKQLTLTNIPDTNSLKETLFMQFPELRSKGFLIAIDKRISHTNEVLKEGMEISFLPPFSGG
ncbi:MAG: MoaD/ThiS family protein [Bacteroidia bacterium]